MTTKFKLAITAIGIVTLLVTISLLKKVFLDGNYVTYNNYSGVLILASLVFGLIFLIRGIYKMWLGVLLLAILATGCSYAKSNQQVVISEDCGMTWKKINAGDAVPKGGVNMCYMKVVIPNYPMQGESKFISNLAEKVRASVHIDYDYSIIDPLAFIKQAKYLGKANTDADDEAAIGNAFEGAENMVIDKRIKDVSKGVLITADIIELNQIEIEELLLHESNKVLEPLGVHLNFITLTFDLDEQTRQAIDVCTAMKIYQSKGLTEAGAKIMEARAGATKITIENKIPETK